MIKISVIGRQNVGKSSLVNFLVDDSRCCLVSNYAGLTVDRKEHSLEINHCPVTIVDTAGLFHEGYLAQSVTEQTEAAINESNLIYFVVSAVEGVSLAEIALIESLRKRSLDIILVVNKVDRVNLVDLNQFSSCKIAQIALVSCKTKKGLNDLLVKTGQYIKSSQSLTAISEQINYTCAILGRANVGKSTLINTIIQQQRLIVGHLPGTTTDSVAVVHSHRGCNIKFVDTAGIRRTQQQASEIAKDATCNFKRLLEVAEADVVLILLDGSCLVCKRDLIAVAEAFKQYQKPVIVAVNKSELLSGEQQNFILESFKQKFSDLKNIYLHFISCKTKRGIKKLLDCIVQQQKSTREPFRANALKNHLNKLSIKKKLPFYIQFIDLISYNPYTILIKGKSLLQQGKNLTKFVINASRSYLKLVNIPLKIVFEQ